MAVDAASDYRAKPSGKAWTAFCAQGTQLHPPTDRNFERHRVAAGMFGRMNGTWVAERRFNRLNALNLLVLLGGVATMSRSHPVINARLRRRSVKSVPPLCGTFAQIRKHLVGEAAWAVNNRVIGLGWALSTKRKLRIEPTIDLINLKPRVQRNASWPEAGVCARTSQCAEAALLGSQDAEAR